MNDPNATDKFGNKVTEVLVDLEGNTITTPGWYDFTRQEQIKTIDKINPSIFTYEWKDGGRYIYGDYYADGIVTNDTSNPNNYISETVGGVTTVYEAVTINGEKQKQKWDVVLDVVRDSEGNMFFPKILHLGVLSVSKSILRITLLVTKIQRSAE